MKIRLIMSIILMFSFSSAWAENAPESGQLVSKDVIIDVLKPKPLMRGISFNKETPSVNAVEEETVIATNSFP